MTAREPVTRLEHPVDGGMDRKIERRRFTCLRAVGGMVVVGLAAAAILLVMLNAEGTTIVMVTHSHPHPQYAQRTVRMLDGQVLTDSTTRESLAVGQAR